MGCFRLVLHTRNNNKNDKIYKTRNKCDCSENDKHIISINKKDEQCPQNEEQEGGVNPINYGA